MLKTINDLKPADYNPRIMREKAFKGLKGSLKEFGDISGIVWNKRSGNLVAGHQRVQALKSVNAKIVKDSGGEAYLEHPETEERYWIRVVDWDLHKEKSANVTANNPEISGNWSDDIGQVLDEINIDEGFSKDIGLDALIEKVIDPGQSGDKEVSFTAKDNEKSEIEIRIGDGVWEKAVAMPALRIAGKEYECRINIKGGWKMIFIRRSGDE